MVKNVQYRITLVLACTVVSFLFLLYDSFLVLNQYKCITSLSRSEFHRQSESKLKNAIEAVNKWEEEKSIN